MHVTDRYEKIRKALAMGPTSGPWGLRDGRTDTVENAQGYPVCTVHRHPDERYGHRTRAAYIAACDPDTIRALLTERDALAAALEEAREDAERYRWLRRKVRLAGGEFHILNLDPRYIAQDSAAELDAAIDAAMQRTSGGDHG